MNQTNTEIVWNNQTKGNARSKNIGWLENMGFPRHVNTILKVEINVSKNIMN